MSCQAVGSHGAAALRPLLSRAFGKGEATLRKVTLSAAAQQKLILCSALLSEVALTFGFKLHISNPYGAETGHVSNNTVPSTAAHPVDEPMDCHTTSELETQTTMELQDLHAVITAIGDDEGQPGAESSPRRSPRQAVVGRYMGVSCLFQFILNPSC